MAATQSRPAVVSTTVRVWSGIPDHWRSAEGGTAGAVLAVARRALDAEGYRARLMTPDGGQVVALVAAGQALNDAVRVRYARGDDAGDVGSAAARVRSAAISLGAGMAPPASVRLCVGRLSGVVKVRADAGLWAAVRSAAALNGMSVGAWIRDGIAAELGEDQARRPAASTVDARRQIARAAALIAQAELIADGDDEAAVIAAAGAALDGARRRLRGCGAYRGAAASMRSARGAS